jgi:hypothetical protein
VLYFLVAGTGGLCARQLGRAGGIWLRATAALLAGAFSLAVSVDALAWATGVRGARGASLASFVIKHAQLLPLAVDVAVGRVPVKLGGIMVPLNILLIYLSIAGACPAAPSEPATATLMAMRARTFPRHLQASTQSRPTATRPVRLTRPPAAPATDSTNPTRAPRP